MDKKRFAFGKENFILLGVSILIIIIGFILMSGGKTTEETGFDPSIFNTRRIVIAPIVTMAGFFLVVWAILKRPKDTENDGKNQ
ncbi:membrane protein [Bacteroidia bacterium]|nr:membrane protein [Bacteroidia bacterium]